MTCPVGLFDVGGGGGSEPDNACAGRVVTHASPGSEVTPFQHHNTTPSNGAAL